MHERTLSSEQTIKETEDADISLRTLKLPAGKHSYLFIVDGQWCEDPECTVRVPNPFGGFDMVRQVG